MLANFDLLNFHTMKTPPLSLYIHLPWCVQKCPYCDFNSHGLRGTPLGLAIQNKYIDSVLQDIKEQKNDREIVSIFLGGGTPSLFEGEQINKLMRGVENHFCLTPDCEVTMEANPGTVEAARFEAYREAGVNRISLGVQSFCDTQLKSLGRIHGATEALKAFHIAREAGFANVNIDIMHGLPKQTKQEAIADLQHAISLSPEHISWYELTLEPNTIFYAKPPPLPCDDDVSEMQDKGKVLLSQHGYHQYEVSAYAKPNRRCLHNLNYWKFGDYIGVGAGAHSKITTEHSIERRIRSRHPTQYMDPHHPFIQKTETLSKDAIPFEFMLNHLRLEEAVSTELFEARTRLAITHIEKQIQIGIRKNLLNHTKHALSLTPLGKRFRNDAISLFLA